MLKRILRAGILDRLRTRFLLEPLGYGRPGAPEIFDREYESGAWAHFQALPELARQAVVVALATELRPNPRVLDLGCGSGKLALLFQRHAPRRYVGVDVSPEGLRQAKALGLSDCEFICTNFESWRPQEKFDVVVFSESLGYAHDPGATVREFISSLAPGGVVVISIFRFGNWAALWRRILRHVDVVEATVVTNSAGQTWDVRILRPRAVG